MNAAARYLELLVGGAEVENQALLGYSLDQTRGPEEGFGESRGCKDGQRVESLQQAHVKTSKRMSLFIGNIAYRVFTHMTLPSARLVDIRLYILWQIFENNTQIKTLFGVFCVVQ